MPRSSIRVLLFALALVGAFTALALATARPGDPAVFPPKPAEPRVTAFLSHNGYHAELALPATFIRGHGGATADALEHLDPPRWVLIGWGDARFYRGTGWSLQRVGDGLRALWPDNPAVLRLTPLHRAPDQAFAHGVLRVELSEVGAERLLRRVDRSFRTVDGRTIPASAAGGSAMYFQSVERFSASRLCNNWTGELLRAAGVPTTPALHVLPQGLVWDVRLRKRTSWAPERR